MTAHSSDSTIPSGGAAAGDRRSQRREHLRHTLACRLPADANRHGPDHRSYRVDTYITYSTPTGGRQVKQVLVVVRDAAKTTLPILARNASTFDQANVATG